MDRVIVYPAAIPEDTDILNPQRFAMNGIGAGLSMTFDGGTYVDGLAATPTAPASMSVVVAPGRILSMQEMDTTAFGSLPANQDLIYKIGILLTSTTFALTAPTGAGQSINYLIEATFEEEDTDPVVLPYYNPAAPAQPYQGPGGTGAAQNTMRVQTVELQLKTGAAANTGTQTTPPTDTGYVPLWVITVNYGQASITSTSIMQAIGAPFLPVKLPQVPAAIQAQAGNYGADAGMVNALAVTLTPAPAALNPGFPVRVKVAYTSTGPATLMLNGGAAYSIINPNGTALASGQLAAMGVYTLVFNGAAWVLQSGGSTGDQTVLYLTAASTLPASSAYVALDGAATFTTMLPTPVDNDGLTFSFYANGAMQTIETPAGVIYGSNGTGTAMLTLPLYATITFVAMGGAWYASDLMLQGGYAPLAKVNVVTLTGAATLPLDPTGTLVVLQGTAAYTVTLPTPAGNAGVMIQFSNWGGYPVTLDTPSGVFATQNKAAATFLLPGYGGQGFFASFISDGTNWVNRSTSGMLPITVANQVEANNTTVTAEVTFTTYTPGMLMAIGSKNCSTANAAAGDMGMLSWNGTTLSQDSTQCSCTNFGGIYIATPGVQTVTFEASYGYAFSANVVAMFIPTF